MQQRPVDFKIGRLCFLTKGLPDFGLNRNRKTFKRDKTKAAIKT